MTAPAVLTTTLLAARAAIASGEPVEAALKVAAAPFPDSDSVAAEAYAALLAEAKRLATRSPVAALDGLVNTLHMQMARARALMPPACPFCSKKAGDPCAACGGVNQRQPQKTQPAEERRRVEDREQPVLSLHDNDAPGKSAPSRLT